MKLKWFITTFILAIFLNLPTQVFAVEYSITNVTIDAHLQENGNVKVEEVHTYEFEGKFNGITRELIPKQGTEIIHLEALEEGKPLNVEQEKTLYRIHRSGKDETITITLRYSIVNGVEVYPDVAEFYWPFFDKSNQSSYENLTVTIHPPKATNEVIAFGYDEAYGKEVMDADGLVHFQFGHVPKKKNGDIRVAYPSTLFNAAPSIHETPMKQEILQEQEAGKEIALKKEKTSALLSTIAIILLPLFALTLGVLMVLASMQARLLKSRALQDLPDISGPPKQHMSLPATILYTNYSLPSQAIVAALLDLVRLGFVKKLSDNSFQIINRSVPKKHQEILLTWLFDEIGTNEVFSFTDLEVYMKDTKNHSSYSKYKIMWTQAIQEEIKEQQLYEKKIGYRLSIGLSSLILLPFFYFFPAYGLYAAFFFTIVLFLTAFIYAICYSPRTWEGVRIFHKWTQLKKRFPTLSQSNWDSWSEDDKMRAFIYALGINEQKMQKKNEELVSAFQKSQPMTTVDGMNITTLIILASIVSPGFSSADRSASQSSGSSISSGGGTGGGGGGSGAF